MSNEGVDVVRGHIEAYRRGDVAGALTFLEDHAVLDVTRVRGVDGAVAHGHDEIVREVRRWMGAFEGYEFDLEQVTDLGAGTALVVVAESGRGKGSGAPVERSMAALYNVVGGKIVRITGYPTQEAALEAAGLSE
jgi:ketosteroid isomerase-like protein